MTEAIDFYSCFVSKKSISSRYRFFDKDENFEAFRNLVGVTANEYKYDIEVDTRSFFPSHFSIEKSTNSLGHRIYIHLFSSHANIEFPPDFPEALPETIFFNKVKRNLSGLQRDLIPLMKCDKPIVAIKTDSHDDKGNPVDQYVIAYSIGNHIFFLFDVFNFSGGNWSPEIQENLATESIDFFNEIIEMLVKFIFDSKIIPSRDEIIEKESEKNRVQFEGCVDELIKADFAAEENSLKDSITRIIALEKELATLYSSKLTFEFRIADRDNLLSNSRLEVKRVYEGLLKSFYESIRFEGRKIIAVTRQIITFNKDGSKLIRIGNIEITIDLSKIENLRKGTESISNLIKGRNVDVDLTAERKNHHPHIYEDMNICFGSGAERITKALRQMRILDVLQLISVILFEINHESVICSLNLFQDVTDLVDEKYIKQDTRDLVEKSVVRRVRK